MRAEIPVSVTIDRGFTFIAPLRPPEEFMTTFGAVVTQFFVTNPLFRTVLPPVGYGPKNNFLSDIYRKGLNLLAGKVIAFMAPFDAFILDTIPDCTEPAKY